MFLCALALLCLTEPHPRCRRAIKVAENSKSITPVDFAKSFGMNFKSPVVRPHLNCAILDGNTSLARQLLKQLEEGGKDPF